MKPVYDLSKVKEILPELVLLEDAVETIKIYEFIFAGTKDLGENDYVTRNIYLKEKIVNVELAAVFNSGGFGDDKLGLVKEYIKKS